MASRNIVLGGHRASGGARCARPLSACTGRQGQSKNNRQPLSKVRSTRAVRVATAFGRRVQRQQSVLSQSACARYVGGGALTWPGRAHMVFPRPGGQTSCSGYCVAAAHLRNQSTPRGVGSDGVSAAVNSEYLSTMHGMCFTGPPGSAFRSI